jgi:phosphopantothenate-cysteine ligase
MSQGTFGSKIALEALRAGNKVTFLKARDSKSPFKFNTNLLHDENSISSLTKTIELFNLYKHNYTEIEYDDYFDYSTKLKMLITLIIDKQFDYIVLAAAVSDYVVDNPIQGKIDSSVDFSIKLKPAEKLISMIKELSPDSRLIGFKLLVNSTDEELVAKAKQSLIDNQCELVIANDLRDIKNNNHRLLIVSKDIVECHESKQDDSNYLAKIVVSKIL